MGGYKSLNISSAVNLSDFCYSQSLRKAYVEYYAKYKDFPGKLISAERQIAGDTKHRLKYSKVAYIV